MTLTLYQKAYLLYNPLEKNHARVSFQKNLIFVQNQNIKSFSLIIYFILNLLINGLVKYISILPIKTLRL